MNVLWIDDDSPEDPKEIEGIHVTSAQSIGEAEDLIKSGAVDPRWVIVDLIVPQNGWEDKSWHATPGIEYLKHLKKAYGNRMGLVAYGIAVTSRKRAAAKAAGASEIFEKTKSSWLDVLRYIATASGQSEAANE
jgi:hypothetical protein